MRHSRKTIVFSKGRTAMYCGKKLIGFFHCEEYKLDAVYLFGIGRKVTPLEVKLFHAARRKYKLDRKRAEEKRSADPIAWVTQPMHRHISPGECPILKINIEDFNVKTPQA